MIRKNKKIILIALIFDIIFILAVALFFYFNNFKDTDDNIYDDLQALNSTDSSQITATNSCPINFKKLRNVNKDIYAWLRIPHTTIDYPICQSASDDAYYLNHTVDGKETLPASIYTEAINKKAFTDRNTVIYGHNMNDGTMFGSLKDYKNQKFLKNHSAMYIYTPYKIFKYKIFSAITYDDRHILYSFDFSKFSGLKSFISSLYLSKDFSNYIDDTISIQANDKIVTLSTCTDRDDQRFLVEAILVSEASYKEINE